MDIGRKGILGRSGPHNPCLQAYASTQYPLFCFTLLLRLPVPFFTGQGFRQWHQENNSGSACSVQTGIKTRNRLECLCLPDFSCVVPLRRYFIIQQFWLFPHTLSSHSSSLIAVTLRFQVPSAILLPVPKVISTVTPGILLIFSIDRAIY